MDTWCDMCGDIPVAYVPIEVKFLNGSKLTINLCLDCWRRFKGRSRKYQVTQLMKIFFDETP